MEQPPEEGVEYYPAPVSREEIERRKLHGSGQTHTTKQVFEHLLSLTTDEEGRQLLRRAIAAIEERDRL